MLKQVRAGKVPEARRGFDQTGYEFDWRDVQAMIHSRVPAGPFRQQALRDLLGLRAGTRRSVNRGVRAAIHHDWDQTPLRSCPADELLDEELVSILERAQAEVGEALADPAQFDRWALKHADGVTHVDMMLRLGYSTWELLSAPSSDADVAPDLDLRDPVAALRQAAEDLGRAPSHAGFDGWAVKAGCPLRAAGIRAQYGGVWSAAVQAAGLTAK
jgi:hypothetical protein